MHHALDEGVVDLAGMKFRCAVLDGEIRVISGTEFMRVMGMYRSGALSTRRTDEDGLHFPLYLAQKNLRQFILEDETLVHLIRNPIRYRSEKKSSIAEGIPGTVLRRLLSVWVRAHTAGMLGPSQEKIAQKAQLFLDGLADLAIDALIDEATGYQKRRAHDSLQRLLAAYVLPEFRPYHTKFPISYYEQLYRVLGWKFDASSSARSLYIARLTNKLKGTYRLHLAAKRVTNFRRTSALSFEFSGKRRLAMIHFPLQKLKDKFSASGLWKTNAPNQEHRFYSASEIACLKHQLLAGNQLAATAVKNVGVHKHPRIAALLKNQG